jgi:hypothetical protein
MFKEVLPTVAYFLVGKISKIKVSEGFLKLCRWVISFVLNEYNLIWLLVHQVHCCKESEHFGQ